jgi:hypothetical protein
LVPGVTRGKKPRGPKVLMICSKLAPPSHFSVPVASSVRSVMIADGGAVLLQREQESDRSVRWIILRSDDYAPVGELVLNAKQRLAWTDGSIAWIVERDEFDVPWMVRYELWFP